MVSLWEIGIKVSLKKIRFRRKISAYHSLLLEIGLTELPIKATHIEHVVKLRKLHKDPFDRLLIGQALTEKLVVISGDSIFEDYGCGRIWE